MVGELRPIGRRSQQGFLNALSPEEQATLESLLRRVLAANDAARLPATEAPRSRPRPDGRRAPTR